MYHWGPIDIAARLWIDSPHFEPQTVGLRMVSPLSRHAVPLHTVSTSSRPTATWATVKISLYFGTYKEHKISYPFVSAVALRTGDSRIRG